MYNMAVKKATRKKKVDPQNQLNGILGGLLTRLEKVENFTLEQAPDVCKEIVASKIVCHENKAIEGAVGFVLGFFISVAGVIAINYGIKDSVNTDLYCIFGVVASFVGFLMLLCNGSIVLSNILAMRDIKAAPKLTVLRGLKRLVR